MIGSNLEPNTITVDAAAKLLGSTKSAIYILIREGKVRHQRLGKRLMVHQRDLVAFTETRWVRGVQR